MEFDAEAAARRFLARGRGEILPEDGGLVYLISDGRHLKIGRTSRYPTQRLKDLQTSSRYDLEIIACFWSDECARTERALHDRFSRHRIRGEWFEDVVEIRHAFKVIGWP